MRALPLLFLLLSLYSCKQADSKSIKTIEATSSTKLVNWNDVNTIDLDKFNADIVAGKPTMDVAVYFPSNLDTGYTKVTIDRLLESISSAKEIYANAGVQIHLKWVKTGEVDPKYFSIQAETYPDVPSSEYVNMYEDMIRHPSTLTKKAKEAFESIVEVDSSSHRTVHLVVLQDVFFPYLQVDESGRQWDLKMVRTGGLSFPGYSYLDNIPKPYRGVITISNLSTPERIRRTVAHEIGHKVMNVSHEYKQTDPGHEVFADGGLMLYGDGVDIPSGKEGRYHLERLLLSPYIYTLHSDGSKNWNPDYKEGGHYYDPIYGNKVVRFSNAIKVKD